MTTSSKRTGVFDLSNSDFCVGSYFSPEDLYEILEIDRFSINEFSDFLQEGELLSDDGLVDGFQYGGTLYRAFDGIKSILSTNGYYPFTSLDEYILKRVIVRTLPDANVIHHFSLRVEKLRPRRRTIDFKIETKEKSLFIEFADPTHYVLQDGRENNYAERKRIIEDATGFEYVIWPYWIQICSRNVLALFDSNIKGLGAIWRTNCLFGDFTIPNASEVIKTQTNRFNAVADSGVGYFYGANNDEERNIIPNPIINEILEQPSKIKRLIPSDIDREWAFWLPEPLLSLL